MFIMYDDSVSLRKKVVNVSSCNVHNVRRQRQSEEEGCQCDLL